MWIANRHMKRCSKSLINREMQFKITMRYLLEWLSLNRLKITNVGEDVKKRELSHIVGGNVNWCSHSGKQYRGFIKN